MGLCSTLLRRTCVTTMLLLAILFSVSLVGLAQTKPADPDRDGVEKDNPLERLKAQEREYGKITPQYRNKVYNEVLKHNQRLQRNTSGVTTGTPGQPTSGATWVNIGPFGQQFGQNGTYTGNDADSGRLRTILAHPTDPNIVYILSSAGGLWKTTNFEDATPNWAPKTDFLPTTAGGAVAFGSDPNVLYLGLGDPYDQITVGGSIVKSTDGGDTWSPLINLGMTVSVRDVKVDTTGPSDVVLVATDGGLWRSTDSGASYSQVTGVAFQDQFVWSIAQTSAGWVISTQETQAITNGNCTIGFRWCIGAGHIYLSTDKGATWVEQTNGLSGIGRTTLGVGTPGDKVIYALAAVTSTNGSAATNTKDLYRSDDGGKTWIALGVNSTKAPVNPQPSYATNMNVLNGQAWYNQAILVDPSDSTRNTVYLGGTYYSAKTTDGGSTWRILSEWLPGWAKANGLTPMPYLHADMHATAYKGTGTPRVMIGSDGGLFVSTDGGATWDSSKNTNLVTHMFYTLIGNPLFPNFVMGGLQDNGTRVRVDNTGIFNQSNGGDGFGVGFSQANAETALQSVYNLSMRRGRTQMPPRAYTEMASSRGSASDGGFYTPIYSPTPTADPTGLVFFTYGAYNTVGNVYKTVNGGINWTSVTNIGKANSGLPGGGTTQFRDNPFGFGASPTNINHMAIGANGGRCFVSLDGGVTWASNLATDSVQGWPGFVGNVTWATDNIIYVTSTSQSEGLYTGVATVRVVKSMDQGATWVAAGNGLPDVPVNKVQVDPRDTTGNTVYAATHVGVYRTTDGGANWAPFGAGLPNVRVNDIYMPPDGGYLRVATYGRGMWQLSSLDYVGASLADDSASCDHNGNLGNNETGHLTLTFSNPTSLPVAGGNVTVTSDNPHLFFTAGNSASIGELPGNGTASASLAVKVAGASGVETANLTIKYGDSAEVTITRPITINYDDNANASGTAVSWESTKHGWTINGATPLKPGDNFWFERRELTPIKHTMAVVDANGDQNTWLVSPRLSVGAGSFGFSFNHRFVYENGWDGGILEISTDGTTFTQIPAANITVGTYNSTLVAAASGNSDPLAGLPAWTNQSTNWPSYTGVTVDLGTAYANQNVWIRFRSGADSNGGRQGWEISDVTFTGLANTPFGAVVPHNEVCSGTTIALTSVANPSNYPDQVTLSATVSGGVTPATGVVTFKEGATVLGSVNAVDSVANFNLSTLAVGTHYIVASFAGDSGHVPVDSSAYKHTVLAVPRTSLTATTLDFGDVNVGQTSAVKTTVLKNTGSTTLVVSSITASGDFAVTHNCSTQIAVNASCTLSITFKPVGTHGARTGSVTVTANEVAGDTVVALTGNAVAAEATVSPASLSFSNTVLGETTAAQAVTVTNTGNLPFTVASVVSSGDFADTNTCAGITLAAGDSCSINVTFTPTVDGTRTGSVTITSDAAGSPQTIALTGSAVLVSHKATLDHTSLTYPTTFVNATSAAQAVVVTNSGNVPLSIASITVTPATDFAVTGNCSGSIAVGASCTANVTFAPTTKGARAATLSITSDADGSPQSVALSGNGEYLQITGTTSQTVSVKDTASFPLTIKGAMPGALSLNCAGAPARTTCTFDNAAPTLANGTASVTVKVNPAPTTASVSHAGQAIFAMFGLFGLMLLPLTRRQNGRKVLSAIVLALVITASVGGMVACGGNSSTPPPPTPTTTYATPGTYTLTVTASSGNTVLQTQTLTLTLQ